MIIYYFVGIFSTYFLDKYLFHNDGHSALATCSVAGGAVSILYLCASMIPSYQPYVASVTSQICVCLLITTFLTLFGRIYDEKKRRIF